MTMCEALRWLADHKCIIAFEHNRDDNDVWHYTIWIKFPLYQRPDGGVGEEGISFSVPCQISDDAWPSWIEAVLSWGVQDMQLQVEHQPPQEAPAEILPQHLTALVPK